MQSNPIQSMDGSDPCPTLQYCCRVSGVPMWRRNEFAKIESGGTDPQRRWVRGADPTRSAWKLFLVVPLHFLALKAQLVVLVSAFVMVSTYQFLVCCSSTHGSPRAHRAQPFVKMGERAPVPHGVGATGSAVSDGVMQPVAQGEGWEQRAGSVPFKSATGFGTF